MGQSEDVGKPLMDIDESERTQTPPPAPTPKKRRLWEKIGVYNLVVLILGTAVIFLALAFILSEWIVSKNAVNGGKIPSLWRLIFRYKWSTRVMTLSTVLVRLATAAQLGVFAAIIAALILERVGVPRAQLPQVSMIRSSNSGPNSLAMSLVGSIFTVRVLPYSFLVILAILDAFALQFTSTILLGDYRDAQIILGSKHEEVEYGFSPATVDQNPYVGVEYWNAPPVAYTRFAEYKEDGSKSANYVDTGKTYRGFLPFRDATTRSALRNYTGPMTVVDARVICVKPTLSDISFDAIENAYGNFPTFRAQYNWKNTHPDLIGGDEFAAPLNCSIPVTDFFTGKPYWATSICSDDVSLAPAARLNGGIRPDFDDLSRPNGHTSVYVLLNTTGANEKWVAMKSENKTLKEVRSSQGPWVHLQGDDVSLDLSVCFTNPLPTSYKVDATSKVDREDTTMQWDSAKKAYDASKVRTMLGAMDESATLEQRGLLQLARLANWTDARSDHAYNAETVDFIWDTLQRNNPHSTTTGGDDSNNVVSSSTFCEKSEFKDSVHRTHVAIFQQTIQQTGNPALALQAVWTVLMQMAYYDFQPMYEVHAEAKYTVSTSVTIPTQHTGLAVFLGLIGLHFALVFIAVLLFFRTEMSLLGNTWQAISQVMSNDTADLVHRGATATDGEVFDEMKSSGVAYEKVRITKCENTGRAQATAVRRRQGDQA